MTNEEVVGVTKMFLEELLTCDQKNGELKEEMCKKMENMRENMEMRINAVSEELSSLKKMLHRRM